MILSVIGFIFVMLILAIVFTAKAMFKALGIVFCIFMFIIALGIIGIVFI